MKGTVCLPGGARSRFVGSIDQHAAEPLQGFRVGSLRSIIAQDISQRQPLILETPKTIE